MEACSRRYDEEADGERCPVDAERCDGSEYEAICSTQANCVHKDERRQLSLRKRRQMELLRQFRHERRGRMRNELGISKLIVSVTIYPKMF
jgi:hypothetical protein